MLGPAWFAIHFDSPLIRNRINQWFGYEWITIHLPLFFYSTWFLIRRWIMIRGCIVICDESKSNRIRMNQNRKLNDSATWIKNKKKDFDSPRKSKSFCDFWFTSAKRKFANQNESIRSESWLEIHRNRFFNLELARKIAAGIFKHFKRIKIWKMLFVTIQYSTYFGWF